MREPCPVVTFYGYILFFLAAIFFFWVTSFLSLKSTSRIIEIYIYARAFENIATVMRIFFLTSGLCESWMERVRSTNRVIWFFKESLVKEIKKTLTRTIGIGRSRDSLRIAKTRMQARVVSKDSFPSCKHEIRRISSAGTRIDLAKAMRPAIPRLFSCGRYYSSFVRVSFLRD